MSPPAILPQAILWQGGIQGGSCMETLPAENISINHRLLPPPSCCCFLLLPVLAVILSTKVTQNPPAYESCKEQVPKDRGASQEAL